MSDSEDDSLEPGLKLRRFENAPENELLPLKVGGKLVRRFKALEDLKEEFEDVLDSNNNDVHLDLDDSSEPEDKKPLTLQEMLLKREKALFEVRQRISEISQAIVSFPQENFGGLRQLRDLCTGVDREVDALARESAQRWALASLAEVFVAIVPGYAIRPLTESEAGQRMKADTKRLVQFETVLLSNYQKFLQILEKNSIKLAKFKLDERTFSAKFGMLSAKCLCKLLSKLSHFNFTVNIINCLVQLTRSPNAKLIRLICDTFSACLSEDFRLELSAHVTKTIANFVNTRKGRCSPQLLRVLLSLRIKEVEKICKAERDGKEAKRKNEAKTKHFSRKEKKDRKRKRKMEEPLREAEAVENLSTKKKLATETIKFAFTTYFRVLKRMPSTALVEPVLEGLAKFAHLINVEFFNDLIAALSRLLRDEQLKLADSLRCVKTACVILSNDGQALNIDPLYFYNAFYALLPAVYFQPETVVDAHVTLALDCIHVLLVQRRRIVPLKRVAAFVKRMTTLVMLVASNRSALALLAAMRNVFVAHPALSGALIVADTGLADTEDCVMNGIFQPDLADPDTCNAMCTSIVSELRFIAKNSNDEIIRAFALNLLHHIPSTGEFRINAQWATKAPNAWIQDAATNGVENIATQNTRNTNPLKRRFDDFCQKKRIAITATNICSSLGKFIDQQQR